MGKLNDKLLEKVSAARDQYFLDIYDRAEKAAIDTLLRKQAAGAERPIIGAEDINDELKKILAEELSAEDFAEETNRVMYHYANYIHLTLFKDGLTEDASDQDISAYGRYLSKFAAIQQTLLTYTLGENGSADAKVAFERWTESPHCQVMQLITFCEHYQLDLQRVIHNFEYVFFKFGDTRQNLDDPTLVEARMKLASVTALIDLLKSDQEDNDSKLHLFKVEYQQSPIYKPLQEAAASLTTIYANTIPTIFSKNMKTGVQKLKIQISERENIAGIDNIVYKTSKKN